MARMCFAQLHGPDGETIEGAASIYSDGEELPIGQWSVLKKDAKESVIMFQNEMPKHWQEELERWDKWSKTLTD